MIGAAHRRKGVVCQDFSLVRQLQAPSGGCLQLLAVADGHGGERYRHSATGSRLACEQAAAAVQTALQTTPLDDQRGWQVHLSHGLPDAIHAGWLRAVRQHWHQQPGESDEAFCSSLYGTTLGLLVLAPGWWGCTGLGDWDLVYVGEGDNRLLNEESSHHAAGEATASLCLPGAGRLWAQRARLQPLTALEPSFSLVLCTDGVRKSCATDVDFLELCSQMVRIPNRRQLAEGLAEISAGGSGDDLSIAGASWWADSAMQTNNSCLPGVSPSLAAPAAGRGLQRTSWLLVPLMLAIGAAAWFTRAQPWGWHGARQPAAVAPAATNPQPWIQQKAERLCREPHLMNTALPQRKQQFSQLFSGNLSREALLAAAHQDPLGALIAWSQPAPQPPPMPGSCEALDQALASQWRALASSPPQTQPTERGEQGGEGSTAGRPLP